MPLLQLLPTVDLFEYNLAGCQILEIEGVFTGTTNFILNDMLQHECAFTESLEKAQARGIAEPNSSFDVDGWDTAAKITILANTVLGADVKFRIFHDKESAMLRLNIFVIGKRKYNSSSGWFYPY